MQQASGLHQVRRVEAFVECLIDRCEQLTRLLVAAVVGPKSREAKSGSQLGQYRALLAGGGQRLPQRVFGGVAARVQS